MTVLLNPIQIYDRQLIGSGHFANVYKGFDKHHHPVAFKVFHQSHHQDISVFENEIRILTTLQNPYIPSLLGYCRQGKLSLLLELCKGDSLYTVLSYDILTHSQKFHIMQELVHALSYLHSQSILYRDMKPDNIVVDMSSQPITVKIVDFGLALPLPQGHDTVRTTDIVGTRGYIAPESILRREYSFKTDIYALGVTFGTILRNHPVPSTLVTLYANEYVTWKDRIPQMVHQNPGRRPSLEDISKWTQEEHTCTQAILRRIRVSLTFFFFCILLA